MKGDHLSSTAQWRTPCRQTTMHRLQSLNLPEGWELLPPGDGGLTRRVKAARERWIVQEKVGRRTFNRGIWALAEVIEKIRAELESELSTDDYARRQMDASRSREKVQSEYVDDFQGAVLVFLKFDARYAEITERLARAVAEHAAGRQRDGCQDGTDSDRGAAWSSDRP